MTTDHVSTPSSEGSQRHGLIGMVLDVAVRFRWAIIILTVFAAIYGAFNLLRLPIDAVPDITNTQVQINTSAPALSPSQVETQVTFPIETGLAGIEGLEMTRSISRNGFSQVTAIFEEGTDLYFARQQVNERLAPIGASLPEGAEPTMGPISTGLGEVLMYTIEYEHPGGRGRLDRRLRKAISGSARSGPFDRLRPLFRLADRCSRSGESGGRCQLRQSRRRGSARKGRCTARRGRGY